MRIEDKMYQEYFLGVSLGFNSSASLWSCYGHIGSLSEERMTGERNTKAVPIKAISYLLSEALVRQGWDQDNCESFKKRILVHIAYSHYEELTNDYIVKYTEGFEGCISRDPATTLLNIIAYNSRYYCEKVVENTGIDIEFAGIQRVEHHKAHAYSPFGVYGLSTGGKCDANAYVLVSDGFGDGLSTSLWRANCRTQQLELLEEKPLVESPALVYQFITGALGFKEHQHEGKVTGLATAFMKEIEQEAEYEDLESKMIDAIGSLHLSSKIEQLDELTDEEKKQAKLSPIIDFDLFLRLKKTVYRIAKETLPENYSVDKVTECKEALRLAVFAQRYAESWIRKFLADNFLAGYNYVSLYLAGGLFANVAINRILVNAFHKVYVAPYMGDEGTAVGAALVARGYFERDFDMNRVIKAGTYLAGRELKNIVPENINERIKELQKEHGFEYVTLPDCELSDEIAKLLSEGNIVHLCMGRNEFGPRALMHRSTLFHATEPRLNMVLNTAMKRNEFMPYAPVARKANADKLFYREWKRCEESCCFMTVALEAKQETKEKYPGAVHIDGTCRVQLVDDNTFAGRLLKKYEELTGELMIINTSFNVHNKPTSNTFEQCFETWKDSGFTGYLVMGSYLMNKAE